jgi:hypothetical protein
VCWIPRPIPGAQSKPVTSGCGAASLQRYFSIPENICTPTIPATRNTNPRKPRMFMELATAPDNVFKIAPISKKKGIDLMTRRKRNNLQKAQQMSTNQTMRTDNCTKVQRTGGRTATAVDQTTPQLFPLAGLDHRSQTPMKKSRQACPFGSTRRVGMPALVATRQC